MEQIEFNKLITPIIHKYKYTISIETHNFLQPMYIKIKENDTTPSIVNDKVTYEYWELVRALTIISDINDSWLYDINIIEYK